MSNAYLISYLAFGAMFISGIVWYWIVLKGVTVSDAVYDQSKI